MSALLPSNRDYLLRARLRKGRAVYDDRDKPLDVEPNGRRKAFWRCNAAGIAATFSIRLMRPAPNALAFEPVRGAGGEDDLSGPPGRWHDVCDAAGRRRATGNGFNTEKQ